MSLKAGNFSFQARIAQNRLRMGKYGTYLEFCRSHEAPKGSIQKKKREKSGQADRLGGSPRQGPRLTLGSQTGEQTPKKVVFQLSGSISQSKKFLHLKAQRNWIQSCMSFKFCHFETI